MTEIKSEQTLSLARALKDTEALRTSFNHNLAYHVTIAETLQEEGYRRITLDPALINRLSRVMPHRANCVVSPASGRCSCTEDRQRRAEVVLKRLLDERDDDTIALDELRTPLVNRHLGRTSRHDALPSGNDVWKTVQAVSVTPVDESGVEVATFTIVKRATDEHFTFDAVITNTAHGATFTMTDTVQVEP